MSADDWIPCPFCSKKYKDQITELKLHLRDEYDVLTAKEYDELKATTESQIQRLDDEEREKSYARVDGTSDYGFNKRKEFVINMGVYCPHCERGWRIDGTFKPDRGENPP